MSFWMIIRLALKNAVIFWNFLVIKVLFISFWYLFFFFVTLVVWFSVCCFLFAIFFHYQLKNTKNTADFFVFWSLWQKKSPKNEKWNELDKLFPNKYKQLSSIWSRITYLFEIELRMEHLSIKSRIRLEIDKYSNENILRAKKTKKVIPTTTSNMC